MNAEPGEGATALNDSELVRAVLAGDRAALAALIRSYDQLLYRTARSILKDAADAEDAVQEAFLLAYRGLRDFRHEAKLSTWLVRITANVAKGRARKRRGEVEIARQLDSSRRNTQGQHVHAPEQPEDVLSRDDTRRIIESSIDALPGPYSVVFVLRAVQEMSVEEIAAALEIEKATVRSRYSRARRLLRQSLSREFDAALGGAFPFAGERCDRMVQSTVAMISGAEA